MKPQLRGQATLVRYADDFVIGFEYKDDAQRVMDALGRRLGHFGLTLHPDKTRLLPFRRPPKGQQGGKGRATFASSQARPDRDALAEQSSAATSSGSRSTGRGPARDVGGCSARHAVRA